MPLAKPPFKMCAWEAAFQGKRDLRDVSDLNSIAAHLLLLLLLFLFLLLNIYHLIPVHKIGNLSARFPALCASGLSSYPLLPGILRSQ